MERCNSLSTLCSKQCSQHTWKENESPKEGPLYDEKGRMRREVKRMLRYCTTQAENRRLLLREGMFASSHPHCFKLPGQSKKNCSRLKVDHIVITNLPCPLNTWVNHFSNLAQSEAIENPDLLELKASIEY